MTKPRISSSAVSVYELIKTHGPKSTVEIADAFNWESKTASNRLCELMNAGMIESIRCPGKRLKQYRIIDSNAHKSFGIKRAMKKKGKPKAMNTARSISLYKRAEKVELIDRLIPRVCDRDADLLIAIRRDYGV